MKALVHLAQMWLAARTASYDIWEVSIDAQDFQFVVKGQKKGVKSPKGKDNDANPDANPTAFLQAGEEVEHGIHRHGDKNRMVKMMANYFSVGWDCRVALGFEKFRAKSAALNLAVYAKEAIKKTLINRPAVVSKYLESVEGPDGVIASTSRDAPQKLSKSVPELICLNIPSYARGADLWKWSKQLAVDLPPEEAEKLKNAVQDFGDSKLEIIIYDDIFKFQGDILKGQKINKTSMFGYGKRLCSREAPLSLNFKEKGRYHIRKNRIYMQIDGEAFVCIYPEAVRIELLKKVQVLINTGDPLDAVPELKRLPTTSRVSLSSSQDSKKGGATSAEPTS
jgi:hypothetical protein